MRGILKRLVINSFHRYWYNSPDTWQRNTFLGVPVWQLPFDLWLYQELIYREKPAFILQTGVAEGGSVYYYSHLLDIVQAPSSALVIGIDIELRPGARKLAHPRIRLIEGSSIAPETVAQIQAQLPAGRGLVILDSDHTYQHVLAELRLYRQFVGMGGYLVVEDTNVNGHPVYRSFGPGPSEAVDAFLKEDNRFVRDDSLWERNLFSFHQGGWLKRVQ